MEIYQITLSFLSVVVYIFSLLFLSAFGAFISYFKRKESTLSLILFIVIGGSIWLISVIATGLTLEMWGMLSDPRPGYGATLGGAIILVILASISLLSYVLGGSLYDFIKKSGSQ